MIPRVIMKGSSQKLIYNNSAIISGTAKFEKSNKAGVSSLAVPIRERPACFIGPFFKTAAMRLS
jgi:hypothetical protein